MSIIHATSRHSTCVKAKIYCHFVVLYPMLCLLSTLLAKEEMRLYVEQIHIKYIYVLQFLRNRVAVIRSPRF